MRYANLQRRWILHKDLRPTADSILDLPSCEGVIIGGAEPRFFEFIRQRCANVIFCSGSADPAITPVVCMDDQKAGMFAADHLINCRLEHFAFYGASGTSDVARKRQEGFAASLRERGYSCSISPVDWPSSRDWLTHSQWPKLTKWLQELPKPIGIMAADDAAAHDLASACLKVGIGVPDHVAIIGVNNDDLLCESAWPSLSSVEADYSRMGYTAAKLLERMLSGEKLKKDERLVMHPPLGVVQRVSTNVLAVGDPNLVNAIRFIREHACDPCSVDDVLREVPVGRRWLERNFTREFGRTLHDEITRVRIDNARRLALQPDLSLYDIAFRCGFAAFTNFNLAFRRITGTTPGAYRRNALRGSRKDSQ
jgi:LacI family transcriptional regulator